MKIRAAWIAVSAVVGLAAIGAAGWTIVSGAVARQIEDRLGRLTGQVWRIEGIALGPGPSLVLTGLASSTAGGSGLGARSVRLSGPFSVLTGGPGMLRVRAEDVTVTLAFDALPSAPFPPASSASGDADTAAGIAAVDGLVTVAGWRVAQDEESLAVSVPAAELAVDLDQAAAGTTHRFDVDLPGHRLRLALDRPSAAGERALRLTLDPAGPSGHRAGLQGMVRPDGDGFRLDRLAGTVDGGSLNGEVRFGRSGREAGRESGKLRIDAGLRLDALTLTAEGVAPGASPGLVVPLPALVVPDPRWFAPFEGEGRLAIGRLAIGQVRMEGVVAAATVRRGILDATLTAVQAYDGALKVLYGLAPAGQTGRDHRLALNLTDWQLRPLMVDLLGIAALDGRATASLDLKATGAQPADLVRSATGSADVAVADGRIDGSGLSALVSGQDGAGTATRFGHLGGRLRIADGQAITDGLSLRSPLIEATGRGAFDLVGQTLDLTFQPAATLQRGRRPGSGSALQVPVRVSGPWTDPAVSADMSALLRDPAGTIEVLQDLGTGLFGGDGGGLGEVIDAIIPQPRQDSPVPRRR